MGKFSSALRQKCPRCDQGDIFPKRNLLPVSGKAFDTHKYCTNCGLRFEREVGFFYGAMFVSYGLNVALFTAFAVAYVVLVPSASRTNFGWAMIGLAYVILAFLLTVVIYRQARSYWLAFFVKRDPNAVDEKNIELAKQGNIK